MQNISWSNVFGKFFLIVNLLPFRTFRRPFFPKPVTGQELFLVVSYSKPALGPWYFPSVNVCIEWSTWQCPNWSCKCHKWLDCPPKRHNHNVRELCACTESHCRVQQWLWTPKVNEKKRCKKKAFIQLIIQVIEQGRGLLHNSAF